ncbi:hypothetical protein IHE45_01G024900, partial [Dioscorea alata]
MIPLKKFDLKQSTIRDERFSPIHVGILPESLFSLTPRISNLLPFLNAKVSSSEKLLFLKYKEWRLVRDTRPLGILPVELLLDKLITFN